MVAHTLPCLAPKRETKMRDPNRDEMLEFLGRYGDAEMTDFDREEAIYWFASDNHGGQWTHLYEALCTSPYQPGPMRNGPEHDSLAQELLEVLEAEYGRA